MNPEYLLELALKHGATAAEVYISQSQSQPVYFEANRLKQIENISSEGTALRLWKNHQPGLAIAYGDIAPETLVEKALALSDLNAPEEIYLNSSSSSTNYASNAECLPISQAQLISYGEAAITQITDIYPDVICSSQWDYGTQSMRLINSLGLDCSYSDRSLDGSISAELIKDEDFLNIWQSHSDRSSFPPHLLTAPILQHLEWSDRNATSGNGKVPILFTAKAADTLWGIVAEACSGRHVRQKTTPWLDQLNQQVISPAITISQNPTLGMHSLPFDDEGTPTQTVTWIDQGMLKAFYGDRRTAAELNLELTGNGFRSGLGSYPSPSLFNLIIDSGSGNLTDLISSISDGILIDQILGDSPDLSGDFAINVDLGYRIKQGKIFGRVKDTMVSGNAFTALNHVIQLGSDRSWQGSLYTPSLIVDGLSVTSKN
ncbi:putative Zn-dependent protease-like protein [Synechococcus sp. PCC 7502]|uniref:TldD/PmbA family protein n=1 Tax=Synechococcus sp. PCC 7502 TaxID=1173263 RepID=UPI00029FDE74|nr:TldD/PmbA family protein [Synechococcus sp. PCC 7502]AFY74843.1 putative Zn-dependent protease-like protein [Synechococcus sp. PCC 7502]